MLSAAHPHMPAFCLEDSGSLSLLAKGSPPMYLKRPLEKRVPCPWRCCPHQCPQHCPAYLDSLSTCLQSPCSSVSSIMNGAHLCTWRGRGGRGSPAHGAAARATARGTPGCHRRSGKPPRAAPQPPSCLHNRSHPERCAAPGLQATSCKLLHAWWVVHGLQQPPLTCCHGSQDGERLEKEWMAVKIVALKR